MGRRKIGLRCRLPYRKARHAASLFTVSQFHSSDPHSPKYMFSAADIFSISEDGAEQCREIHLCVFLFSIALDDLIGRDGDILCGNIIL